MCVCVCLYIHVEFSLCNYGGGGVEDVKQGDWGAHGVAERRCFDYN